MINTSCRQFPKFISLMIVFLFVFSCIHLPAEAEEEADTDVLTGEQDAEKQRVKAEKQAKSRKVFDEIEAVSFEQILADPDNVESGGFVEGFGLLDVTTRLATTKTMQIFQGGAF